MPLGRSYRIAGATPDAAATARLEPFLLQANASAPPAPSSAPAGEGAAALAIGMDDPSLRPSLERTALSHDAGQPRQAMTSWVMADDGEAAGGPPDDAEIGGVPLSDAPWEEPDEAPSPAATQAIERPCGPEAPEPARPTRPAVALVLGAGAGVTWGTAVAAFAELPFGPAAFVGCACGLVLTGGLIAWTARKS